MAAVPKLEELLSELARRMRLDAETAGVFQHRGHIGGAREEPAAASLQRAGLSPFSGAR